jgi:1,4-alpha-glucan branching enzyme
MPGQERFLAESGLRFSFLEAHGLTDAHPRPSHGVMAPVLTPGGVVFFGRDMESSRQVWSAESGYPGDYDYREFYKDIGWELPLAYLGDILPDGIRKNVGIKYYRVTGKVSLGDKQPYVPAWAREKAASHAAHFLEGRINQVRAASGGMERPPIVVSPYDAELFGHWWFEGPWFLEAVFRRLADDPEQVEPITLRGFLHRHPAMVRATPAASTWGAQGHRAVWIDPSNAWMWRHVHHAGSEVLHLARTGAARDVAEKRALRQAEVELLLLQASDWPFILKMRTAEGYASARARAHAARLRALATMVRAHSVDLAKVDDIALRDDFLAPLGDEIERAFT